jgi:hypothetical protein
MTDDELIRRARKLATADDSIPCDSCKGVEDLACALCDGEGSLSFIAAARTLVPQLADALELSTAKLTALEVENTRLDRGARDALMLAMSRMSAETHNELIAENERLRVQLAHLTEQAGEDSCADVLRQASEAIREADRLRAQLAHAEQRTVEAIAAWLDEPCPCGEADCKSRYRAVAKGVRDGDWKETP